MEWTSNESLAQQVLDQVSAAAEHRSRMLGLCRAEDRQDLGTKDAHCEIHGAFASTGAKAYRGQEVWSQCPDCLEALRAARAAERKAAEDEAEKRQYLHRLEVAGVPLRFTGCKLDDFAVTTKDQEKAMEVVRGYGDNCQANIRAGESLIFAGMPGTGKTHLALALLQIAARHGFHCRYETCQGMIQAVRRTWGKDGEGRETDVLDEYSDCQLLVLDEVGVQSGTDAEKNLVFSVLDRRYAEMRSTILITNQDRKGFTASVGERVVDRFREMGAWVPFTWNSYRPAARKDAVR